MTQILRTPKKSHVALILFIIISLFSAGSSALATDRRSTAAKAKASSARDKKTRAAARGRESAKEARASKRGTSAREERASAARDRNSRASAKDRRTAKNNDDQRGGRALSRRERAQESRRLA